MGTVRFTEPCRVLDTISGTSMNDSLQNFDDGDLREQIDALLRGVIEHEQFQQLQDRLKSDPAARELYLAELEVESLLNQGGENSDRPKNQQPVFPTVDLSESPNSPPAVFGGQGFLSYFVLALTVLATTGLMWSAGMLALPNFASNAVTEYPTPLLSKLQTLSEDCKWYVEKSRGTDARSCRIGDVIRVTLGQLAVIYPSGTRVVLQSPAAYELTSATSAKMLVGRLTATVPESGIGFTVITPQADVIDLGTEFGVDVESDGATDVVVFEGEVDVDFHDRTAQVQRLQMGEAVRLDAVGTTSRLNWINGDAYSNQPVNLSARPPLISEVRDNIERDSKVLNFYEIIPGGLAEDALAYVDRIAHQYNGVDSEGLPSYLIGADYVKMFNSDKFNKKSRVEVTISAPANLYILIDNRETPPQWLTDAFRDTGDDVGLDNGPYQSQAFGKQWFNRGPSGVGPGVSIDDEMSVWVKQVASPGVVELGPMATTAEVGANMYGILATPLESN